MQFFSRFIILILTGLLIVSTLDAQLPQINPSTLVLPHRLLTLKNGLTVILHQDRSVPIVSVNIWYHVGSANEKAGRTGFAHLFEHLMFEGSANVPDGEFDALLEAAGGNNNGSTTTDRTNYYEDVPSNALELALFLESDRMGHLTGVIDQESSTSSVVSSKTKNVRARTSRTDRYPTESLRTRIPRVTRTRGA